MFYKIIFFIFIFIQIFFGERIYLSPKNFVSSHIKDFSNHLELLLLEKIHQKKIESLIGKAYPNQILRFWKKNDTCVWILEDIGKTQYITIGFVTKNKQIKSTEILIYRESHGYEINTKSFTKQFENIKLSSNNFLNKKIYNIAGATLSVQAVKRMGQLALYLDELQNNILL